MSIGTKQRKRIKYTAYVLNKPLTAEQIAILKKPMKWPKRIARVSPRRTNQMAQYAKVKARFLDQNPYCFRCNENVPLMFRTVHHFYGRVHALLIWVPGFRTACMRCHNWIESNRNDSVRLGFRAPDNLFNRPSLVIPR